MYVFFWDACQTLCHTQNWQVLPRPADGTERTTEPKQALSMTKSELQLNSYEFTQNTNWVVITGAPSAGKTSVLKALAGLGHKVIPEVARGYIEKKLSRGLSLETIREDESIFQKKILSTKQLIEARLPSKEIFFFDRAIPDSITHYRLAGLNPNHIVKKCFKYRYNKVFLLERFPIAVDHARTESEEEAAFLQFWLEKDYRKLGYDVIDIPVMSVRNRVELILSHLSSENQSR